MTEAETPAYALLDALSAAADRGVAGERTLLLAPTRGEGREILRALARRRGGWIGFEVTTARPLALELVGPEIAAAGISLLDAFAEQALLDELLDEALAAADGADPLAELADRVGFRAAVRDAMGALRLAGVGAERLASTRFGDRRKRDLLVAVLSRYERRLESSRLTDTAGVLRRAAEAVRGGAPLPHGGVLLLPGLGTRGVAGAFLRALEARGARRLAADPVPSMDAPEGMLWEPAPASASPPEWELFRAAGIMEELREVLRRALHRGLRWDEVEIVTPDPGAYGPALHALTEHLGIPATFAVGLPVERTRAGRAVAAYLRWLQDGFPDSVLRRLLEAGDLAPPAPFRDVNGPGLSRALRRLRVGWGRDRYLPAVRGMLERLEEEGPRPREEEDPGDTAERHQRLTGETRALEALLQAILGATPRVEAPSDPRATPVAPAELARGLTAFLSLVPPVGPVDVTALERLGHVLDRVEATLTRPTTFAAALAILSEHLAIRIPAPRAEGRSPWGSAGGHIHLSDIEHGGWTARPGVFVVGLDAGRFPGQGSQDPVLLDSERAALAAGDLPGSGSRLDERRFRMGALLARLRGRVTLSHPAWEPSEGRALAPSPLLLDVLRAAGAGGAGYRDLDEVLGQPISRIPPGETRLDREDVWLGALAKDGHLLAGETAVRAAFPRLNAGLAARAAREGNPSAHHGLVGARPELDPRRREDVALSASRLEQLGTCGLRYFYQSVLRVRPPDDPTFDPECWLDPLRRGSLLHAVYERVLREATERAIPFADAAFAEAGLRILKEEATATRREVPAPSHAVWRREMDDLESDLRSFVGMIRDLGPDVLATELAFGRPGADHPPVPITLPGGGRIRLAGAIDRVDRLGSGDLRVVDYKTGSNRGHSTTSVFRGGRRLQHALYAIVAGSLLDRPVAWAEYHFPTRKGENAIAPFDQDQLKEAPVLVDRLLDLAAAGRFLPTEDASDCFICDFKGICRASIDRWGEVTSPPAAWGRDHAEDDAYARLRAVREWK